MNSYLLIALLLASSNAMAALNKWVDENGEVHYSDTPPPSSVKAKQLSSAASNESGNSSASAPAAAKTMAEKDADLKRAQKATKEAADKAAREKANADNMKANCANAQDNLRSLQSGMRMMEVDANGQQSFISDEQRQQRIQKNQQDIATYCK